MRKLFSLAILSLLMFSGFSQKTATDIEPIVLKRLSVQDSICLANIPVLELPASYLNKTLPYAVDNSLQPYMREPFQQDYFSCGQASCVSYNFTYEVNRKRGLPANTDANLYPTHFAYNWNSNGVGNGVSYFHTLELLRTLGTPNVADYGGMAEGSYTRWMSGYDLYYNSMHNRITEFYTIPVGTAEGLLTLKHWINDHLDGSTVGGLATFYSQSSNPDKTLPAGTPEAGAALWYTWGSSANHAMTIVGYNDSIRYDVNGDGQYTNDIDINFDGVVDMKDWEIGGLKMVNSYGGVPNWGDGGYAYILYHTVALAWGSGGCFWNQVVHVQDVKENLEPQLAYKIQLKHTVRNQLKIYAGISTDVAAAEPSFVLEFPIIDYQGAERFMQGGTTEADKTIEFGLDVTPLLNHVEPGQNAKYFFYVDENDPYSTGTGDLLSFSLMDYTNGITEIPCASSNIPLNNNSRTTVSVTAAVNYEDVQVVQTSVPEAPLYTPYSFQLNATGGSAPYYWEFATDFTEVYTSEAFPAEGTQPISFSGGKFSLNLPFSFPFYEENYDNLIIDQEGRILFTNDPWDYPYNYDSDEMIKFKNNPNISVFNAALTFGAGQGAWYTLTDSSLIVRWKAEINGVSGSEINCQATLRKDGSISYHYGTVTYSGIFRWCSGMSSGDQRNWQYSQLSGLTSFPQNSALHFTPRRIPDGLSITRTGEINGMLTAQYEFDSISIKVTDNNNISSIRTVPFTTSGVQMAYSVIAGGNSSVENNETAVLSVGLKNIGTADILGANMEISTTDPFVTLIDSLEALGDLPAGDSIPFSDAFTFFVDDATPDNHVLEFNALIINATDTFPGLINITVHATKLEILNIEINDGNNSMLDPGETAQVVVSVKNIGGATAQNITGTLSENDPYLTVLMDQGSTAPIEPDSIREMTFTIECDQATPLQYITEVFIEVLANQSYVLNETAELLIGFIVEDFETGNLFKLPWELTGDNNWFVESNQVFERAFSAASGDIADNQLSTLSLTVSVLEDGDISFWKKVSSETNYDFLEFYIDGTEYNSWSGNIDWSKEIFPINAGTHTFEWTYSKDVSVSTGSDCAWLDYIIMPPIADVNPQIEISPGSILKYMPPEQTDTEYITITNIGEGTLHFDISLENTTPAPSSKNIKSIDGTEITTTFTSFNAGETYVINFTTTNQSTDSEWLRDIFISFPAGVSVVSASNFTGGNADMIWDGTTGDNITVNWHGEDGNGWGVVVGGQSASAMVEVAFDLSLTSDIILSYQIDGDIYGADPHTVSGDITFNNIGQMVYWMSLGTLSGSIASGDQLIVEVEFNTTGMNLGTYTANINITDNAGDVHIVPVTLHITNIYASTDSIYKSMDSEMTDTDTIIVTNLNPSTVYYSVEIPAASFYPVDGWITATPAVDLVTGLGTNEVLLTYNTAGLTNGFYDCELVITDIVNSLVCSPGIIPIRLAVDVPVDISENKSEKLQVWPNPSKGEIYISIAEDMLTSEYIVFSSIGQKVCSGTFGNSLTKLNLKESGAKSLSAGTYYITTITKNGVITKKLIVVE